MRQLISLYRRYQQSNTLKDILAHDEVSKISAPLLIFPFKDYLNSQKKVMIVGQETYTWRCDGVENLEEFKLHEGSVKKLLRCYREFDFAMAKGKSKSKRSPFWRFHQGLCSVIGCSHQSIMWSNLMRCDYDAGSILGKRIEKDLSKFQYGILKNEIEILKPDLLLFLTGPRYDKNIKEEFGEYDLIPIPPFTERQFAKLTLNGWRDIGYSPLVIRTYHPAFLNRHIEKLWRPILHIIGGLLK